jgi:hypothetical protein
MTDELQLMRDCLPEQAPPAPEVVTAARTRLAEAAHTPARRGRRWRYSRGPLAGMRPARRTLLLRGGVPAGALAVAAAVAVAVSLTLPAAPPTPSAATGGGAGSGIGTAYVPYAGALATTNGDGTGGGRDVLLMAATKVSQAAEPAAERYYVTTGTVGTFIQEGPANDRYMLLEEANVQNWAARSPNDGSPDFAQQLGTAPVSAADRAAWRRDGSPTKWNIGQTDGLDTPDGFADGSLYSLTASGGPLGSLSAGYGLAQFDVGPHALTLAQLRALPANPAKLEKLILSGKPEGTVSQALLQTVPAIMEMPVTPAVRAALYRMLAGVPGMVGLGQVTDPAGQRGEAVGASAHYQVCGVQFILRPLSLKHQFASCTVQEILIIDPATGLPMANELRYAGNPSEQRWPAPDGLFSYEIFGNSYWTNQDRPLRPANP